MHITGSVFNCLWKVATLNLENGATDSQLEALISQVGHDVVFCLQEFTRASTHLFVDSRSFALFASGTARKRLAIIVPEHFAGAFLLRHYPEEYYYAIEFETFAVINVHFKRVSLELLEEQLQKLACILSKLGTKPIVMAGDFNCSFSAIVEDLVGPYCGEPRPASHLLLHFVAACNLTVQNSFYDLGPTRVPPPSRPGDASSHLDWVLTRNCKCDFCEKAWPRSWEGVARIASDHALLTAGTYGRVRVRRQARLTADTYALKGWLPPSNLLAEDLRVAGILQPYAWTWASAWDPSFPCNAVEQQFNHTPCEETLITSLNLVRERATILREGVQDFSDDTTLLQAISDVGSVGAYRHPSITLRHLFPRVHFDQALPADIRPVLKLVRAAKRKVQSIDLASKNLRRFIIRMEAFVLRALRRRQLFHSTTFDEFMR